MNKKIYLIPLLLLAFVFTSCEETKEISKYDNWQERNDAFIDSLYNVYTTQADHGGLERIQLLTNPSAYIFYKKLAPVETLEGYVASSEKPLDGTTKVDVYYKGVNILKERFDGFTGSEPTVYDEPLSFSVTYGSIIDGWWEVLQQMSLGERWEVYIPWNYGYGSSGSGSILGYSTLIFDMQLFRIVNTVQPTAAE